MGKIKLVIKGYAYYNNKGTKLLFIVPIPDKIIVKEVKEDGSD